MYNNLLFIMCLKYKSKLDDLYSHKVAIKICRHKKNVSTDGFSRNWLGHCLNKKIFWDPLLEPSLTYK